MTHSPLLLILMIDCHTNMRVEPNEGMDDESFVYYLELKCRVCDTPRDKKLQLYLGGWVGEESVKCKFCGREGSVEMIKGIGRPKLGRGATPLMGFRCIGLEPISCEFGARWKATNVTSGRVYTNLNLATANFTERGGDGICGELHCNV